MNLSTKILCAAYGTYLFYAGQAGFVIKSKNGQLLAVDLYLSDCVERVEEQVGFKRLLPKLLSPSDVAFDYIIATHAHLDHFDMDSVPEFLSSPNTYLYASEGCKSLAETLKLKQDKISYIRPGDIKQAGDFQIEFVACDHGQAAPDAVGVIIMVDGKKIYMTGDTCLRMDRIECMKEKGPFDIITGPINGAFGNMDEKEFAVYSTSIGSKKIIPCHYGMFGNHGGNVGTFLKEMEHLGKENTVYIMTVGEQMRI